ncbi:NADH-ubiquinone oxidoreductase B12 subunit family [Plasmodiophora brassicae]|uniref:Uncharacterized protein n=2 Tax=Plasmodiophora brassicae TaxID=37360 RepID=A0A3P3YBU1_PLABS|nr:unnamed protein product [Plasmodiophora brassicae]
MSERWRKHPMLTGITKAPHIIPGWRWGVSAFLLVSAYEYLEGVVDRQRQREAGTLPDHGHGHHNDEVEHEPPRRYIIKKQLGEPPTVEPNPDYKPVHYGGH